MRCKATLGIRPPIAVNRLCLLSGLTSAEWAAWIQALGSIAAVIGAAWVAIWQSRRQHQSSLAVLREEHRLARTELTLALLTLSRNCARAVQHAAAQLQDREAIHLVAWNERHFDAGELGVIENAVLGIPLHQLPHTLVTPTMVLGSTLRQFRQKVASALGAHREMNAGDFADFFRGVAEMQASLQATCGDIEAEVARLEGN